MRYLRGPEDAKLMLRQSLAIPPSQKPISKNPSSPSTTPTGTRPSPSRFRGSGTINFKCGVFYAGEEQCGVRQHWSGFMPDIAEPSGGFKRLCQSRRLLFWVEHRSLPKGWTEWIRIHQALIGHAPPTFNRNPINRGPITWMSPWGIPFNFSKVIILIILGAFWVYWALGNML